MQRLLTVFVCLMLVIFIVPQMMGKTPVPLSAKLKSASYICTTQYDPFPEFPDPSDYDSNFWDDPVGFLADYGDYLINALWGYPLDILNWFVNDIRIALNLGRVFLFNKVIREAL